MKAIKIGPAYLLTVSREYDEIVASLQQIAPPSLPGMASSSFSFSGWPISQALREVKRFVGENELLYVLDPEGLWDPSWGTLDDHWISAPSA
jgi:hypothetical protein